MNSETGEHAPRASAKRPDTNKKIIWPVAPDGYIPNSVVRNLAPYPKLSSRSANRGLQMIAQKEDAAVLSAKKRRPLNYFIEKYCSLKEVSQNESEETKTGVIMTQRAMPQSQYLLQNRQKILQQKATSVVDLQKKSCPAEDLQVKDASSDDLQTNAASVQELKSKEDGVKDQSVCEKDQSLCENSNAFPTEQSKKVKKDQNISFKLPEAVSTKLQEKPDEVHLEIKEQKKSDTTNKSTHVPEIVGPKRTVRHPKKLKFVPLLPPLRDDRRPNSILIYLYKRSKEESAHERVKRPPTVA